MTSAINLTNLHLSTDNTAAEVSPSSPEAARRIAIQTISAAVGDLNAALVDVINQVSHASPSPQSPHDLADLVTEVLEEINGSLNKVVSCLGLQTTLSFLGPLVPHLNQLLQGLQAVVPNLLALVKQLLGGLSQVLSGLNL